MANTRTPRAARAARVREQDMPHARGCRRAGLLSSSLGCVRGARGALGGMCVARGASSLCAVVFLRVCVSKRCTHPPPNGAAHACTTAGFGRLDTWAALWHARARPIALGHPAFRPLSKQKGAMRDGAHVRQKPLAPRKRRRKLGGARLQKHRGHVEQGDRGRTAGQSERRQRALGRRACARPRGVRARAGLATQQQAPRARARTTPRGPHCKF